MTSEQLQATRAIRWRQNSFPILTLEDAQAFLQQTGLCIFLPRKAQLNVPAPSFVEACIGQTNPTPPRAAIEAAREMLSRLIDANLAIALNLLGTPADHPDFIVSPDTLPFVFAMRGDRDWKHAPGSGTTRVSPLVQQVWKVIERKGVLSADELKNEIGRELTEAAALRALYELWGAMRVVPLYQSGGEPTLWEALQTRQQKALNAGTNMSQVTALSVLVSLYLESAVAATSDGVEIFLSPLTSRSKVREAVRGLTATRQLAMIPMERETLLYVEGSLPELEESVNGTSAAADVEAPFSPPVAARRGARRPTSKPGEWPTLSISAKQKLPDTISVWPRPVAEVASTAPDSDDAERPSHRPPARSAPRPRFGGQPVARSGSDSQKTLRPRPPAQPRPAESGVTDSRPADSRVESESAGKTRIRSFAASGSAPRRERTPARPPWKDKGKPGFAKSATAKGEKARWPRERAAGGPSRAEGPRTDAKPRSDFKNSGEFKPRSASAPRSDRSGTSGEGFKPRREFKAASDSGPRASRPAGERGSRPSFARSSRPREGSGPFKRPGEFKPRGDFKDFKARKPGDFKRSSSAPSGSGARAGGFKASGGGFKPSGARPPFDRSKSGGDRARPGGEFRQPWKDGAGKSSGPRPPYQRAGSAGPRPSRPREREGETGARPAFKSKFEGGFKGGFKKPGGSAGPRSASSRTTGPRTTGPRPAFGSGSESRRPARAGGGFSGGPPPGNRSRTLSTGGSLYKGARSSGPRSSGSGAFRKSGPGRSAGPPRPKRKPE